MRLKGSNRHPIAREVRRNTLTQKRNCLTMTTGKPGVGKSCLDMDLMYEANLKFNPEVDTVFRADEYLRRTYELKTHVNDQVLFDDVATQEGMANREWYSIGNKALVYTFTTQRWKRLGVWLNTRSLKVVDTHLKQFIDIWIDIKGINHKRREVTFKAYKCNFNPVSEELYKQYFKIDGHRVTKFIRSFDNLQPEILKAYNKKSEKFKQELGESLQEQVETQKMSEAEKNRRAGRIKRQLIKMYNDISQIGIESEYLKLYGGKWVLDNKMIMGELEVGLLAGRKASAELYVRLLKDGFFKKVNKPLEKVLA